LGNTANVGTTPTELGDALPALSLSPGQQSVALATGDSSSCVLLEDGRLKCWGSNGYGQLGLGDVTPRGGEPGQMGDELPFVDLGSTEDGLPGNSSSMDCNLTCGGACEDDGACTADCFIVVNQVSFEMACDTEGNCSCSQDGVSTGEAAVANTQPASLHSAFVEQCGYPCQ
jgi:hypothetical protein